jgi:HSP20 family protein
MLGSTFLRPAWQLGDVVDDLFSTTDQLVRMMDQNAMDQRMMDQRMLDQRMMKPLTTGSRSLLNETEGPPMVRETDSAFQVAVEAPGVDAQDLNITFDEGTLYISGETKVAPEVWSHHCRVDRAVPLAPRETIDVDKIEASYEHGMLYVKVPKKKQASGPRRIPISAAGSQKALEGSPACAAT